jgi:aminoglycoside phosphotransferase (APT) family kinase protein
MDHAAGQPLLSGLNATTAIRQAPALYRRLPDHLAQAAAQLHHCPADGPDLDEQRESADIDAFLTRIADQAHSNDRPDLADLAGDLAGRTPDSRVICHGDLHPFNLLSNGDNWTLVDWSAAVVADPHYDLAFTTLMLANPPLGGPAPVRAIARSIGNKLAGRFLRSYEDLTSNPIDPERLNWGHTIHALRALIELSTWEHQNRLDEHRGHPWLTLRPTLEAQLASYGN